MSVTLVGITRPMIAGVDTASQFLAYCARVSSGANQMNHETGGKLLRFLTRRKEWSPFEMVSMTLEIETTRDVARQILRHRSFSFQEFSGRYAVFEGLPEMRPARMQDTQDRQNSLPCTDQEVHDEWNDLQAEVANCTDHAYRRALSLGIAKEVARSVLPEGQTMSRLYMAGNLRSWIHYVHTRADKKTQLEHRLIAYQIRDIIKDEVPEISDLLGEE